MITEDRLNLVAPCGIKKIYFKGKMQLGNGPQII